MHSDWPLYLRILLDLHIACGVIAFICAPVALISAKGGNTHRRWGKIYFWAMTGVAVTALALSFALPIFFLAMVAVFSFYSSFAAYRILYLKDMYKGGTPQSHRLGRRHHHHRVKRRCSSSWASGAAPDACRHHHVAGHPISIVSVVFGLLGMRLGTNPSAGFLNRRQRKDVLVVRPHAGHDRQLHRRHDRLLRRQPRPLVRTRPGGSGSGPPSSASPRSPSGPATTNGNSPAPAPKLLPNSRTQ